MLQIQYAQALIEWQDKILIFTQVIVSPFRGPKTNRTETPTVFSSCFAINYYQ